MICTKCESDKIIGIIGKCADRFHATYKDEEYDGYVPEDLNIGGDKYIEFDYCTDCGLIQGDFPISNSDINQYF
jgi:hypothetical protein